MLETDYKKLRARILGAIKAKGGIVTTTEISSEFKLSWNTAEKYLLELFIEHQIERLKKTGVNLWVLRK